MSMFCYQCEQTLKGVGCTTMGICGKDEKTANLQDLLTWVTKSLGSNVHLARQVGVSDKKWDRLIIDALFTTMTNVNFDSDRIAKMVKETADASLAVRKAYETACKSKGEIPKPQLLDVLVSPSDTVDTMLALWEQVSIESRKTALGDDASGVLELAVYGLKGAAAYSAHATALGMENEAVYAEYAEILYELSGNNPQLGNLFELSMRVGKLNFQVMEMLDTAHTEHFGHPVPTNVAITPVKGKAILVSGHDLLDLEELLKQTEGLGINVYTHGEMLPAHGYPELKKYKHLVGNYGGAWQKQVVEFANFPGSVLMTTNCIQNPTEAYKGRIFTCNVVGYPGVTHIENRNFKPLIDAALAEKGFEETVPEKTILVGFGHNAVMSVAGKVIDAVKAGKIRRFYLVGGCDGAKPGRNYYTDFATKAPKDTIIMTLACGKYRFNKLEFGDIDGIPRLLDIGQCNDAYSAIKIASALAEAFETDINSLPLSLILSWYEQKACAILLTLLSLGVKNIKLGPTLPAFISPSVLNLLVEKFNISPIGDAEEDLAASLS